METQDWKLSSLLYKAHPWHGVSIGDEMPDLLTAYIEIVPADTVKYEIDKLTGHLKIDRPQKYSNVCPVLYGFIPQTICGQHTALYCSSQTGREGLIGDDDPVDICVLSEKNISHGDILIKAYPIGGLRLLDGKEVDDKIIAVMKDDAAYADWKDISDCPAMLIERLKHYFLTYKDLPGSSTHQCELVGVYGREQVRQVILKSYEDYKDRFGELVRLQAKLQDSHKTQISL